MITRRRFLSAGAAGLVAGSAVSGEQAKERRKKMAIVTTEWRYPSHAWHMGERFLARYPIKGQWHRPPLDVGSPHVDQFPENDLSRQPPEDAGVPTHPPTAAA